MKDYDPLFVFSDKTEKCGYFNKEFRIVIPPQFFVGDPFSEGLAAVHRESESLWGYIDKKGEFVIPDEFVECSPFCDGRSWVLRKYGGGWEIIDKTGRTVGPLRFRYPFRNFSEGLAVAKTEQQGKEGFVGRDGNWALPPEYERADSFAEGLAPVRVRGKWGFIDRNGEFRISPLYDYARCFSDGLACVNIGGRPLSSFGYPKGGRWGFVDQTGKIIIEPCYSDFSDFHEGYAKVRVPVSEPKRDDVNPSPFRRFCRSVLAGLGLTDDSYRRRSLERYRYGYIDKTGRMAIGPEFCRAERFSEGLAAVSVYEDWDTSIMGYINRAGELTIPAKYETASEFRNGLAKVTSEKYNYIFYIDKTGKMVWPPYYNFYDNF
ncbi:MAG: WG repeat-containing protein [Desulfobacterales bacterium]